ENLEGQQIGIALRLVADVDERLALIIAAEEGLGRHRRDQEAEGILFPVRRWARGGRLRSRFLQRRTGHTQPLPRTLRPYRRRRASGSGYFGGQVAGETRAVEPHRKGHARTFGATTGLVLCNAIRRGRSPLCS